MRRDGLGNLVDVRTGEIVSHGGALCAEIGSQAAVDEILFALDSAERHHGFKAILPMQALGQGGGTYSVDMYTGGKVYVRKSGKPALSWWLDIFLGTPYDRQGGVALRYRQAEQSKAAEHARNYTRYTHASQGMGHALGQQQQQYQLSIENIGAGGGRSTRSAKSQASRNTGPNASH